MIELCIPFVFFLEKPISFGNSPMLNEKIAHLRLKVPKSIMAIIFFFPLLSDNFIINP